MQPLIQDIFYQIIDSSPYLPERFCDFSCMRFPFKKNQKVLSHVNSFWSEIYKKCLSVVELLQFEAPNLCGFDQGLEARSR